MDLQARAQFQDGIFVGELKAGQAINRTCDLLQSHGEYVLFELYFKHGRCVTWAGVLIHENDGLALVEVKSSLVQKTEHVDDLAYTTMVMQGAGVNIRQADLMLVNKDYTRGTSDAPLFWSVGVTEEVLSRAAEFEGLRPEIEGAIMSSSCPDATLIWPCRHCEFFANQCVGKGMESPIFETPRLREKDFVSLLELGHGEITSISTDF